MTDAAGAERVEYGLQARLRAVEAERDACERAMLALHESTQRLTAEVARLKGKCL